MSVDSVNSYNSQQSSAAETVDVDKKKKRKNWVRYTLCTRLNCTTHKSGTE